MRRHVPWHVRSALVTVFRDLCVARSGAGSRNTFTWSRLGRAVGAGPDLNAQPYPAIPFDVTIIITRRTPGGVAPRGPDPGRMRARRPRARPRRGRDVERSRRVLGVHAGARHALVYTRARNRGVAIGHSAGTTSVITSVICY